MNNPKIADYSDYIAHKNVLDREKYKEWNKELLVARLLSDSMRENGHIELSNKILRIASDMFIANRSLDKYTEGDQIIWQL